MKFSNAKYLLLCSILVMFIAFITSQIVVPNSDCFKSVKTEAIARLKEQGVINNSENYNVFYLNGLETKNGGTNGVVVTNYKSLFYFSFSFTHNDRGECKLTYIYKAEDNGGYDQIYPVKPQ